MKHCRANWVAITLLLSGVGFGQDETPIVRVDIDPATVAVGQSARMRITVLVPTWFPQPPVYPDFELANAITRLPADSSYPTSERIDGDTWSGIVRNYRIYPLTGASYRITGETLGVTWANPGAEPLRRDVAIPDVELRATVPAGAEALDPYLAGTSLSLALETEGSAEGLEAGDAIVLRYTAELDGLPAIFLPPLAPPIDIDGVSVYADEPEVEDGSPAGRRERLTLVFEAGGEFTIPEVALRFWNMDTASVETVTAAAVSVSVAGPAVAQIETDATTERPWWQMGLALAALAVVLVALCRIVPGLAGRYRSAAERRRRTEAYSFRQVRSALRGRDPEGVYQATLAWLSRLAPGVDARGFADAFGDASLRQNIDALSAHLFTGQSDPPNLDRLEKGLVVARARFIEQVTVASRCALPSLNP